MPKQFGDYTSALAIRDLIKEIVGSEVEKLRPRYRYGVVVGIDRVASKASVIFTGESTPVDVFMGALQPRDIGQRVRVAGIGFERFIDDVIGKPYISFGDIAMDSPLPLISGGTGGTTAGSARSNLGAASLYHTHETNDVTSGTFPVIRGGTGASDAAGARINLEITPANIGASGVGHTHSAADMTSGVLPPLRIENLPPAVAVNGARMLPVGETVYDTGWVNIALASGFTARSGFACQVRRIGFIVHLRGIIDGNYTTSFQVIGTVPVGFRPAAAEYWKNYVAGAANHGSLNINAAGVLQGAANVALTGNYLSIVHTWMVN